MYPRKENLGKKQFSHEGYADLSASVQDKISHFITGLSFQIGT